MSARNVLWLVAGSVLLAALAIASVALGSTFIPFGDIVGILSRAVSIWVPEIAGTTGRSPLHAIVVDLRLPRVLLAIMVGAGLGVVGLLLQTVTRNDLADPFLFGLSSGAAAGSVFVITVSGNALGFWTLPLAAFVGGVTAASVVLLLVQRLGHRTPEQLVLAGLSVSFLFSAITYYLVFSGDQRAAHSVLFWSLGGLGLARWTILPLALAGTGTIVAFAIWKSRQFDALLAGETVAASLGVDPSELRRSTFLLCAFSTALFVSVSGVIGFVGLMVPHMARMIVGPLHGPAILASAYIGAMIVLASDLAARTTFAPQELPIGIVTSSVGALFVIAMILPRRAKMV